MTTTNRPIRRALVSVFHKEGIEVLAEAFIKAGTEVVSTGSTAKRLAELGVKVTEVSEITGFPECLDGRVKTLDPHIHAGILADMTNADHAAQLERFGIKPFDLVVVNLYPFADTVRSGADEAATIEKIDIGGPSMVRGAAKNSATVAIVTDPKDYASQTARASRLKSVVGLPARRLHIPPLMMRPSTNGPPSIGRSRLPSNSWSQRMRLRWMSSSSRQPSPVPGIGPMCCVMVRILISKQLCILIR